MGVPLASSTLKAAVPSDMICGQPSTAVSYPCLLNTTPAQANLEEPRSWEGLMTSHAGEPPPMPVCDGPWLPVVELQRYAVCGMLGDAWRCLEMLGRAYANKLRPPQKLSSHGPAHCRA